MAAPHRHRTVEFSLVVEGTAAYLLSGRRYDLSPGSLVWLFPGQEHILVDRSPRYRDWLGLFDAAALRAVCASDRNRVLLLTDPPGHFARRLDSTAAARLEALFGQVARSDDRDTVVAGLRHAIFAAWDAFQCAPDVPAPPVLHPAVAEAARLLKDGRADESVDALARAVGLGRHHLGRLFRQQTGVSVSRFRNEQRLCRFRELYEAGVHPTLLDTALAAGFGSYPQFYRVVRQLTGLRPTDWTR
ncbi:helix-turn-helix domain-containing protein [Streptomyces sp. NPDC004752]